jgi:hypothetical protein
MKIQYGSMDECIGNFFSINFFNKKRSEDYKYDVGLSKSTSKHYAKNQKKIKLLRWKD